MPDHSEAMRPLEHSAGKTEMLEGPHAKDIVHPAEMSVLDFADLYRSRGWSVIPLRPGSKKPRGPWAGFQLRHATDSEVQSWWAGSSNGIGIIAGAISGIVIVDIDGPEGEQAVAQRQLPVTPTVITARGRHLYFAHPGTGVTNRVSLYPQVDVRGDGDYVVAPPSVHESGSTYAWAEGLSPWEVQLADCPQWVVAHHEQTSVPAVARPLNTWQERVVQGVREGARNATVASLTGHLLAKGVYPCVAESLVLAWAKARTHPRLDEDEVQGVIDSIALRELSRKGGGHLD